MGIVLGIGFAKILNVFEPYFWREWSGGGLSM